MERTPKLHDAWASLLAYPDEAGSPYAAQALFELEDGGTVGSELLGPFRKFFREEDVAGREELFTRTFDGSDDRALEVGWHLHGENYARGALMVRLRKLLAELDLFETSELPDHLGVVLGLVGRLDEGRGDAMARGVLLPALAKLMEGFGESSNPYYCVLARMQQFLAEFHGADEQRARAVPSERSESQ